jgi:class 3 adenylate cyclase/tetratricopeptide (TPR) repeat protein
VPCPICGTINPDTHRYCSNCGAPLHPVDAAPSRSERRLVSVLFSDLVAFTSFSEVSDPEDVRALLTRYFDLAREIVERFGGHVDKFIGDAVMAVWGAPEAHEDDAERAVRAALELVDAVSGLGDEMGTPLQARAGVLTGEASVGPGGNDRGLVVGDLVNTASRLQSLAAPGRVAVGESTYLAVGDAMRFEALGAQPVRGREEPVVVYRAVGVSTAREGRAPPGLEPPFVAREEERRFLKDQLHAVARDRRARLVSIVGEPGIGKHRLVLELRKYADGIPDQVLWHEGRSPAFGEGLALWPVAEMVRQRIGITEGDDTARGRMRLRTALADLIADEAEQRWSEPLLAGVLGLDDVPRDDRNELFAALRTVFQRVADLGTCVLVFDDLHHAEPTTLDFIVELVERSTAHPILVVTLARPELIHRVPDWGSARHNTFSIHLAPLPDVAMRELVAGLVPGFPDTAAAAIAERAGGVPLYAVEFVRMLLGAGSAVRRGDRFELREDLDLRAIPDTLQSIIGARLDRLPADQRGLLQDASVLGLTFYADGLAAIRAEDPPALRERLHDLARKELIAHEDDPRPQGGDRYRFVQGLIREVAYSRLSRADRHAKHLQAAEHFESLGEIDLAGKVAHHYRQAMEAAPPGEADLLRARACSALCSAAARAANLQAHAQALDLWQQAIDLNDDPAERARIHESAAVSARGAGNVGPGIDHAGQAAAAYAAGGDEDGRLRSLTIQAKIHDDAFQSSRAVALLEPLHESAGGSAATRLGLALEFARALMLDGDHARAADVAERALAAAQGVVPPEALVDGIVTRATALAALGRSLEATALLLGAVALADEHRLHTQAIRALNNLAVVVAVDSPRRNGEIMMDMLERARRFADPWWLHQIRLGVSSKLHADGRFDESRALLEEVDIESLPEFFQRMYRMALFSDEAMRRPSPEAFDRARELLESWEDGGDPRLRGMVTSGLASLDLLAGDPSAAAERVVVVDLDVSTLDVMAAAAMWARHREAIGRALELCDRPYMRGRYTEAIRAMLLATLDVLDGRMDDAVRGFTAAIDGLDAVGSGIDRAGARCLFAALLGDHSPEAARAGRAALDWIREVGAVALEHAWAEGLPTEAGATAAG